MTIPPINAGRVKVDHWSKSPHMVKVMFREAYTELVEKSLRPCKFNLPYHHIDLNEVFIASVKLYGIIQTCKLQKQGFDEACELAGLKPAKRGDCL